MIRKRWKIVALVILVCAIMVAQQPVAQGPQASTAAAWLVVGGGTAGSPGTAALTIQGIGSGTPVPISGTVTSTLPTPSSSATYALTIAHASSAAAANIKASAGNLYGMVIGNGGTVPCWVQLFNNASTPAAGTSVIDSYMVQAGLTVTIPPATFALEHFSTGIAFAGATSDSGGTTTGCTTTLSTTFYYN